MDATTSEPGAPGVVDSRLETHKISIGSAVVQVAHGNAPLEDERWLTRVAGELAIDRTLFVAEDAERLTLAAFQGAQACRATQDDAVAVASSLFGLGRLPADTPLQLVTKDGQLTATPSTSKVAITHADHIRTPRGLTAVLEEANEPAMARLVEQIRSPMGVIPFLGAGMSKAFGMPDWGEFLREAMADYGGTADVAALIKCDFEAAADELERDDYEGFQRKIEDTYGRLPQSATFSGGPLWPLASMATGPVITTNFDHVLEAAFAAAGNQFDEVVAGAQIDRVVRTMHTSSHALLKIHGDALDRTLRVLTAREYRRRYPGTAHSGKASDPGAVTATSDANHDSDEMVSIPRLSWVMFTNRPLLFVGCSLDNDRTVTVLRMLHKQIVGLTHFAIVGAPFLESLYRERQKDYAGCGIVPVWFMSGCFDHIVQLLWRLHSRTTNRTLRVSTGLSRPSATADPIESFATVPGDLAGEAREKIDSTAVEPVVRRLVDGRLVFILGPFSYSDSFDLDFFAKRVAATLGVKEESFDTPAELLRRVVDSRGSEAIVEHLREHLPRALPKQTLACRLLAALPAFLRARDRRDAAPLIVFTTRFDSILEQHFDSIREPFRLYTYIASGEDEGRFAHRDPDGSLEIVERPEQLVQVGSAAPVIVKLRGGVSDDPEMPDSVVVAKGEPEAVAAKLPTALPRFLRSALRERNLLLCGFLDAPEIDRLVRYATADHYRRAWCVACPSLSGGSRWREFGVESLGDATNQFLLEAHAQLQDLA